MFILFDLGAEVWGVIRKFLLLLDSIGLTFIDDAYGLIMGAATAFNGQEIAKLAGEISQSCYIIIGIFALFRIALSLVNTMINPDKLNDKQEGFGSMLSRLIITVVLFVAVPIVFDMSRDLQNEIMTNNYISKILIGKELISSSNPDENPGKQIKDIAVRALIKPDERIAKVTDGSYEPINECAGEQSCEGAIEAWNADVSYNTLSMFIGNYVKQNDENIYVYSYTPIITMVVGIFITYVLLSFAIDIAIRTVELVVLEVLSPLFIVTFIDPKSGSKGTFSRWLSACGKSYLSLFIRIAIVCLMLLLISKLDDLFKLGSDSGVFLKLLLLIAILIFAKKAPKWIGNIIGMDGEGLGGLGIGKKMAGAALAGGAIAKGMDSAKKWGAKRAKRLGAGAVNRLGANIGGSIAGISAARKNALGDESLRAKREAALKETGSRLKAAKAAGKSFFSKDDRAARKEAIAKAKKDGVLDYKTQAKEARMSARVNATDAALNGKFVSAISLGQGVKKQYDPGYMTHDEKRRAIAESQFYANTGGFNMADINFQKKIRSDLDESRRILGQQTYANAKGEIYLDPGCTMPAIYNEKTIKKWAGEHVMSFADLGAYDVTGDKNVILAKNNSPVMIKNADGYSVEATVPLGTMLKQTTDKNRALCYSVLMTTGDIKDTTENQNVLKNIPTGGEIASGGKIEVSADGNYVVKDKDGKVISTISKAGDGKVKVEANGRTISDKDGTDTFTMQEAMTQLAFNNAGGEDSTLVKHLDAAFASLIEGNASKFISYEQKISESSSHIAELQTKKTEQLNLQQSMLSNTEYGAVLTKKKELQAEEQDVQSLFGKLITSETGTVVYNGETYDRTKLQSKKEELAKSLNTLKEWENTAEGGAAKDAYEKLSSEINESVNAIEQQIAGEKNYIAGVEAEKRKICSDVAPIIFDNTPITTANYESYRTRMSQEKEKKDKIAQGSLGVPVTSGDKKD